MLISFSPVSRIGRKRRCAGTWRRSSRACRSRRAAAAAILRAYLKDDSRIVRAFALDSFWQLAKQDRRLKEEAAALVKEAAASAPPAVRARARKLLKEF